jgi:hypothetical protein
MSYLCLAQASLQPDAKLRFVFSVQQGRRQWREHPIAQRALVFVAINMIGLMRTGPILAALVVMRVFTMVMVVGATRHQVAELVRHLQPHHGHPDRQQRDGRSKGETGWTLGIHGCKGRPVHRADGSEKCKHEEIVILSQLERCTLHLPVFLSNAT